MNREIKWYRLEEDFRIRVTMELDAELLPGEEYIYTMPRGRMVLSRDHGIARPTIHGGGVHRTVTDPGTGWTFRAVTDGFVGD